MNRNRMLTAFALVATLGWNAQAWAGEEHHDSHRYFSGHGCCEEIMGQHAGAREHLHHLLSQQKAIGLTDEQMKKLKAIDLDYDRARIKSEAEIRIAERELQALVEDEKSDMAAIEAKVKQSEMLEAGLRVVGLRARREALTVLTPEQHEKAKAAHERTQDRMYGYGHGAFKGDYKPEEKGHPR